jgi:hypothetical protein
MLKLVVQSGVATLTLTRGTAHLWRSVLAEAKDLKLVARFGLSLVACSDLSWLVQGEEEGARQAAQCVQYPGVIALKWEVSSSPIVTQMLP